MHCSTSSLFSNGPMRSSKNIRDSSGDFAEQAPFPRLHGRLSRIAAKHAGAAARHECRCSPRPYSNITAQSALVVHGAFVVAGTPTARTARGPLHPSIERIWKPPSVPHLRCAPSPYGSVSNAIYGSPSYQKSVVSSLSKMELNGTLRRQGQTYSYYT